MDEAKVLEAYGVLPDSPLGRLVSDMAEASRETNARIDALEERLQALEGAATIAVAPDPEIGLP